MEQEISGLKVCRQLLLLQTLIQIRPQVVIFTGLLQRCKQWGYSTSTGEYVTHTFPIKFTVIPIVVAGALTSNTSGNTGSQSNPCYRSITVSNFVFCMYDNARGYAGSTYIAIGYQLQWGYYTAAVGAIYTDVTTPVSFSKCFIAESIDTLLAASTTWPGTTQTVWNINASNGSKIRFIWSKPPVELDGAVWFGIFI